MFSSDLLSHPFLRVFPDGRIDYYYNTGVLERQDNMTALKELLSGTRIEPGLCNKIFRSRLFLPLVNNSVLPCNIKIYEDLLLNFYLFSEAKWGVYEDICPYHYLLRVNSATTSNQKSSITDPVKVLRILKDKLQGNDALYPIAYSRYIYMLIRQGTQRRWQEESSAARACLKKELVSGGIWKFCSSGKLKLMALAVVYALPLYRLIYRCRDKLIGASKKYDV